MQCAAACKWLQYGSGLVDAFLTGMVDACVNLSRDAPTLGESSCRELQGTPGDVRPFTKATPRKTNQRGTKRGRSMILTETQAGPIHVNLNKSGVDLASRVTIFNAVVFVIPN